MTVNAEEWGRSNPEKNCPKPEWEIRLDRMEHNLSLLIEEGRQSRKETKELRQTIGRLGEIVVGMGGVIAPLVSESDLPSGTTTASDGEEPEPQHHHFSEEARKVWANAGKEQS